MTTQSFYHLALVTHIAGLTIMAGTTLVDFIITRQFWKLHANNNLKGLAIQEATSKFTMLFGIGILLLILSGVYMMYVTHGAYGEQIWFRIKFGFVIAIILNGIAIGRRQGLKLRKILSEEAAGKNSEKQLLKIKANINRFHISQLVFFLTIFTLSVFKFN